MLSPLSPNSKPASIEPSPVDVYLRSHRDAANQASQYLELRQLEMEADLPDLFKPRPPTPELQSHEYPERISELRRELGYENSSIGARGVWDKLERDYREGPMPHFVLRILEEIRVRQGSIQNFADSVYDSPKHADFQCILDLMHYRIMRDQHKQLLSMGDAAKLHPDDKVALSIPLTWYLPLLQSNAEGIAYSPTSDLKEQYIALRELAGYSKIPENVKNWWTSIEVKLETQPTALLRLTQELCERGKLILDLFAASIYGQSDHFGATLAYLDHLEGTKRALAQVPR